MAILQDTENKEKLLMKIDDLEEIENNLFKQQELDLKELDDLKTKAFGLIYSLRDQEQYVSSFSAFVVDLDRWVRKIEYTMLIPVQPYPWD